MYDTLMTMTRVVESYNKDELGTGIESKAAVVDVDKTKGSLPKDHLGDAWKCSTIVSCSLYLMKTLAFVQ